MKNFKDYIFPSLALILICFVVTLALAAAYTATEPVIAQVTKERADAARTAVLPAGEAKFTVLEIGKLIEGVIDVYIADNKTGIVITSGDKGFGGKIRVMTGFDPTGKIVGIKLIEHKETPGLGTKVMMPAYLDQYIGKSELTGIDAISGSTISSMAMFRAVEKAVKQFPDAGGALKQ
jgi:electron transport complex protein RnfG